MIRKGARSRFIGPTFKAADASDLNPLAKATDRRVEPLTDPSEGSVVRLSMANTSVIRPGSALGAESP